MPFVTRDLKDQILFRVSPLEFYKRALSSVGGRRAAGRFNRAGLSALYFAIEPETALAEAWGSEGPRPVVILPVKLSVQRVIDITAGTDGLPADWQSWDCDWKTVREEEQDRGVTLDCASWRCGDHAIAGNMSAILFPSVAAGGTGRNLVLFQEHAPFGSWTMIPIDPGGEVLKANPPTL